jgi:CubicO group peptidase (beta-lactamase class C family)
MIADPAAALDRIFAPWSAPDAPGASVALLQGGEVVVHRCYGAASIEHGLPTAPDGRFHVASITKTFCAAALVRLANEGRVSLDDAIRAHVPELRTPGPISLRRLLSMTSGLRDSGEVMRLRGVWYRQPRTMQDQIDLLCAQSGMSFPTGERFIYTNVNFMLATRVIERVTGMGFEAHLRQAFLDPLGMTDTLLREDDELVVPRLATPYVPQPGGPPTLGRWAFGFGGAGSMVSSVADLVRWLAFLRATPDLLGPMRERAMLNDGTPVNYGLGLQIRRWRGLTVLGHGGSLPGWRAYAALVPDRDMGLVLLTNRDDADPDTKVREILDAVLGGEIPDPHPHAAAAIRAHPAAVPAIDGLYLDQGSGEVLRLQAKEGRIEGEKLGIVHQFTPDAHGDGFADAWPLMPARLRLEPAADGGRPTAHLWYAGQTGAFAPLETVASPDLADLVGTYANAELRSEVVISNRGGQMHVHYGPAFHGASGAPAIAVAPDVFWVRVTTPGLRYEHAVRFRRDGGRVTAVVISSDRVKDVPFNRVSP